MTSPADQAAQLSIDELRALQLSRLQWTLHHAYANVPFYQRSFEAAGVHPDDCHALDDLAHFPITTKQDLRDHYPFGMFAVPGSELRRIHASSGTTGQPCIVGYTAADLDMWTAVMARSLAAAGVGPGDRVHIAFGYGLFTGGLGFHYAAERLGCAVIPVSGGMTTRQVQLINDLQPQVIAVTPSYMLALLDEFESQGLDPRRTSLRVGIFGAEPWTEQMRAEIEERVGIDALDSYGLSEVIGPGVAAECLATKDGLHVWEDHFYPEVIDPLDGRPLADGEAGELVFTSLTKEALPIVRYRTRDLSRLLPGTAWPAFRRMEKVIGRSDDMIILRGVNVFPTQLEEIVLRIPGLSPHFQIELTKDGRLDRMTIRVERRHDTDAAAVDGAAASLVRAVKDGVGVTVVADIVEPNTLERSAGKLRRLIDRR